MTEDGGSPETEAGQEAQVQEDLVDEIWELDPLPDGLNCDASVSDGPRLNNNGLIVGEGTFNCHESVFIISLTVCLSYNTAGTWEPMGCRHKDGSALDANLGSVKRRIKEPCIAGQALQYRLGVRGYAVDGAEEDRDAAKRTATYFCPVGALTAAGAIEYGLDLASLE